MRIIIIYCILLSLSLPSFGQQYKDHFKDKSLRFDFYLWGTNTETHGMVADFKAEKYWAGPKDQLIDELGYGNFRVLMHEDGQLIYSKGFNTLFQEWQTTAEAKEKSRMYYQAMQLPYPKKAVVIKIERRNWEGEYELVFESKVNPDDYFIREEAPLNCHVEKILYSGKPEEKVDVAIIAEGYTKDEMNKFRSDCKRMVDHLFTVSPFDKFKDRFNFYGVEAVSQESNTDIPGDHQYRNTVLNSSFYTFDSPRYLTTSDMKSVADAAANVPYDQVYVLVNSDKYGGGGIYNFINLTSVDHEISEKVFVHEFGHGFAGLADEYYTSSTSYSDFYNLKVEPWEPNITTMVDFEKKWKNMIERKTPVPTPRSTKYSKTVGVFEGGGYVAKGIYSPFQDCIMKSNRPKNFCPVCSEAIIKMIERYSN
ncbi:peptidase [Puteibacter caeruleilacunae]|nr:peptidase [Puteibacter caeruleilacunae]